MFLKSSSLTKKDFARKVVLPALVIFAVPISTWIFALVAQTRLDAVREDLRRNADQQQAKSLIPHGQIRVRTFQHVNTPEMNEIWNNERYSQMMWISAASIVMSLAVCVLIAVAIFCSIRFRAGQYYSLLLSWYLLPVYAFLQTICFTILFEGVFCWATEYWFEFSNRFFGPFVVFLTSFILLIVAHGIFRRYNADYPVDGVVLTRDGAPAVWHDVDIVCLKMATPPPDHLIAGIHAYFFASEWPIAVQGAVCCGKTVFLSLPLLKLLNHSEAHAVIAHEMAHFAGRDTYHGARISPLLRRFHDYIWQLHFNLVTRPASRLIDYFLGFFLLAISRQSRQDEWRADEIAAGTISARDVVTSCLKMMGYIVIRRRIESDLIDGSIAPEDLDLPKRIDQELKNRAGELANDPEVLDYRSDDLLATHPTLNQLSCKFEIPLTFEERSQLLLQQEDGGLYWKIPGAEEVERKLWKDYESRFGK